MSRNHFRLIAFGLGITLAAWGWTALAQQGPVTQGLNDAGRAVKRGFQSAGQAVSGGFQKTRTSVHNMELVSRVYSRLHWDKTLISSTMEIEVQAGGITTLTGVVPNEAAKAKAIALTADTVGVIQVVDQLTVGAVTSPATVVPGTPATAVPSGKIIVTPPPGTSTKPPATDTPL